MDLMMIPEEIKEIQEKPNITYNDYLIRKENKNINPEILKIGENKDFYFYVHYIIYLCCNTNTNIYNDIHYEIYQLLGDFQQISQMDFLTILI